MATITTNVPEDVAQRIWSNAPALGQFRRIFEDKEHDTAETNTRTGWTCLGLAALMIVIELVMVIVLHRYFVKMIIVIPILLVTGIGMLIRGAQRGRLGREFIGVFDGGIVSVQEKQPGQQVVRFGAGQPTVSSSWSGEKRGRRAKRYILTCVDGANRIKINARDDAGMVELNDVLTRFPGQRPIQREKEAKYVGA